MPLLTDNVSLVNVVGKDFWTLLQILNCRPWLFKCRPKVPATK